VFWPGGWHTAAAAGGLDLAALAIFAAAAIGLFRFRLGVIPVIAACGASGLVVSLATR
jgi:chromate transporter